MCKQKIPECSMRSYVNKPFNMVTNTWLSSHSLNQKSLDYFNSFKKCLSVQAILLKCLSLRPNLLCYSHIRWVTLLTTSRLLFALQKKAIKLGETVLSSIVLALILKFPIIWYIKEVALKVITRHFWSVIFYLKWPIVHYLKNQTCVYNFKSTVWD